MSKIENHFGTCVTEVCYLMDIGWIMMHNIWFYKFWFCLVIVWKELWRYSSYITLFLLICRCELKVLKNIKPLSRKPVYCNDVVLFLLFVRSRDSFLFFFPPFHKFFAADWKLKQLIESMTLQMWSCGFWREHTKYFLIYEF